ncbi:MAG: hypothetical protein IKU40_11200 [Clostridia bacterium]|nr:hypothetical protein [Clostridia bacterium]
MKKFLRGCLLGLLVICGIYSYFCWNPLILCTAEHPEYFTEEFRADVKEQERGSFPFGPQLIVVHTADEDGILYTCHYFLLGTKEMFYGGDGLWDMQKPLGGI